MSQLKPFKILSEQEIAKAGNLSLIKAELLTPTNEQTTWGYGKASDGVIILPLDHENNVYLIKQWRIIGKTFAWELPAGGIDKDSYTEEDVLQTANKELQEEAGIKSNKLTKLTTCYMSNKLTIIGHIFLAQDLETSPLPKDEHEYIEIQKLPFDQAFSLIHETQPSRTATLLTFLLVKNYLHL